MDSELVSKKELLELADISYGQLYRWKRKNLIPEEWFIRKSTFTGQETFFPKDKMLSRIDKIKNMKDDLSLDELADMFSPLPTEMALLKDEITERNIVSKASLDFYVKQQGENGVFNFEKLLYVYLLDRMLQSGEINWEEGGNLLRTLVEHYRKFAGKSCELIMLRKMGASTSLLIASPSEVYFESGVKVVARVSLTQYTEELKLKIT